jgi:putative secretion ATPase (PEP-CTERM system associated)
MYETFYGLSEKPFNLTPDPDFLYMSSNHKKAMTYLKYGIESKEGFVQLSGEIGSGKTTLLRSLLRGLDRDIRAAYIVNPRGTFRQILRTILDQLDVVPFRLDYSKERLLNKFQDFLRSQEALNHPVVLIFDEAQNLDISTLEELRMLSNYETDKRKLVQIILVGQPELRDKLARPELTQLSERIAVRAHLGALPTEETRSYILHRLQVAGSNGQIRFDPAAFEAIQEYSQGIPRRVNVLCNNILLAGFVEETRHFTDSFVRRVIAEMDADEGSEGAGAGSPSPHPAASVGPIAGAVAASSAPGGRWRRRIVWASVAVGGVAVLVGVAALLNPEWAQQLKDVLRQLKGMLR